MIIARDVFCPWAMASTITKSRHPWWMRESAAVRPAGPAPTISTVVLSGRDIMLRSKNNKEDSDNELTSHVIVLVFKAMDT
jgi:hypothetical protein